jgi:hypothetical protein
MKTPRELLLERHREARSKLDAIRREALAGLGKNKSGREAISVKDLWHSLRWHLAGMGAIWVFVLFLHLDTGRPPQMMASIPTGKIPSPRVILVSLRENRRQLAEMMGPAPPE